MDNKKALLDAANTTAGRHIGDKNDLSVYMNQLVQGLTDYIYENCFRNGGAKTLAYLDDGDFTPPKNVIYTIEGASGTLTAGSVVVTSGDLVYFNGEAWVMLKSNSALRWGGAATYNALEIGIWESNILFELTTAGTLTLGTLAVVKGDVVYYDGAAWNKVFHNEAIKWGGAETSVNLEAQEAPTKNVMYTVSSIATSATVGSLTTAVGDIVMYDGAAWIFIHNLSSTA